MSEVRSPAVYMKKHMLGKVNHLHESQYLKRLIFIIVRGGYQIHPTKKIILLPCQKLNPIIIIIGNKTKQKKMLTTKYNLQQKNFI